MWRTVWTICSFYTGKRKLSKAGFTIDKPAPRRRKERSPNGRHQILQRSSADPKKTGISDTPGSSLYHSLLKVTEEMQTFKGGGNARNTWQARQGAGKGSRIIETGRV